MKIGSAGKTTLIYVLTLSLLLGTAVFILSQASATTVKADLEIDPDRVDLEAYPENFKFTLGFSGRYKDYNVTDIDRESIHIEGLAYPIKGKGRGRWKVDEEANTVTFKVDGEWLVDYVIWPKIYHMARTDPQPDRGKWFPYKIDITVTGLFYDGTDFSGTDIMHVYTSGSEAPPPPPPE